MPAKRIDPRHLRRLLPALAIGFAYVVWGALPQYRRLNDVASESEQHRTEIRTLQLRVGALPEGVPTSTRRAPEEVGDAASSFATNQRTPRESHGQSYVQALAAVLDAFRSEGVECAAAEHVSGSSAAPSQRLTLTGDFANVLATIEKIEAEIAAASVANLTMHRADPSQPCRWEIEFEFREPAL